MRHRQPLSAGSARLDVQWRLLIWLVLATLLGAGAAWPPAVNAATSTRAASKPPMPEAVPDELVIGFRPESAEATRAAAIAGRGARTVKRLESINAHVIALPAGKDREVERRAFQAHPAVRYAEPNYLYHVDATPNDPDFSKLWGLHNTGQLDNVGHPGTPGADIDAATAWNTTTGSRNIVVGVVDTGIDYAHPDLAANIWSAPAGWSLEGCSPGTHGFRSISGTSTCDPLDDHGHGTHVAGTIGAVGNNGIGVTGVNWQVSLMALKFIDSSGSGSSSDAVTVIDYAIRAKQNGVNLRVLNNSWVSFNYSQALLDEIMVAANNGILVVAAAGNASDNTDMTPYYPASYSAPNVVAVAATNNDDVFANFFSNYGIARVHLAAPGAGIYSTIPGGLYDWKSGTSMATPHVAGAAALLLSAPGLGSLTVAQMKHRLVDCGEPLPSLTNRTASGKRLNVAQAIADCSAGPFTLSLSSGSNGSASVSPAGPSYPSGQQLTLTATPDAGYQFAGWTINGQSSGAITPLVLDLYSNLMVTATFTPIPPPPGLEFYPLSKPVRLLDTRGAGFSSCLTQPALTGGQRRNVQGRGLSGECATITGSARALTGNVTIYGPLNDGYLTLFPANLTSPPGTSTVNYVAGQTIPNAFTVGLGPTGWFSLYSAASTHVIIDITGYYAPPNIGGLFYHALPAPVRLLDTRPGFLACYAPGSPLQANTPRTQPARVSCNGPTIPAEAVAVTGNATVVANQPGQGGGYVTIWPGDQAQPETSVLNYLPGEIVPNSFTTQLSSATGTFRILAQTSINIVIDITGYYSEQASDSNSVGLLYRPLTAPLRLLDTRAGFLACDAPGEPLAAGGTRTQRARRTCPAGTIPNAAQAVVGNATVVATVANAGSGWITLWPADRIQPNVSNLNFVPNTIRANGFIVGLGGDNFKIYAEASVHFVVDITGYLAP